MKKNQFLTITIILLSVTFGFAQESVQITPKKITYTRTAENIPDFKKKIDVTYPIISGKSKSLDKVREAISYWKNFDTNLDEIKFEAYTYELTYDVNYNGNGILDLVLTNAGAGAYPSEHHINLVIDVTNGKLLKIRDVFKNRDQLYKMIEKAHQVEIKNVISKVNAQLNDQSRIYYSVEFLINQSKNFHSIYEIEKFTVSDKGVTFLFDYNFPHIAKADEPSGRYFFTWKQLKPFLHEFDVFEKFVNKDK